MARKLAAAHGLGADDVIVDRAALDDLQSALYEGTLAHARRGTGAHAFSYQVAMAWLALEELPGALDAAERMSARLKALADPMRLRLLSHIAAQGCDSVCACDLLEVVDISQPTISHHLKKLVEAGLLTRDKRGVWAFYALVPGALDAVADVLRTPQTAS